MTTTIDLAGHIERSYTREHRGYQGMSSAGDCMRKSWFRKHHPELEAAPDAAGIVTLEDGHLHETEIVDCLASHNGVTYVVGSYGDYENLTGVHVEGGQFSIVGDGELRGHIDGLVCVDGKWHILECKAKGTNAWARLAKAGSVREGSFGNYAQAQMYLHFRQSLADELGITIEPTLLYIAKNKDPQRDPEKRVGNGVYYEEWIEYNESDARVILAFEATKGERNKLPTPPSGMYLEGTYIHTHDPSKAYDRGTRDALCRAQYCGLREACMSWR